MKKWILLGLTLSFVACSRNAEVTWHKNCDAKTNQASLDFTVPLYSEPSDKSSILENVAAGTIVKVFEHKNHNVWDPRYYIRVQTASNTGYMSPKCFVVNQDPRNSVWRYSRGLVKNYSYFYDPNDKEHYPKGYSYKDNEVYPKEKVPLNALAEGLPAGPYAYTGVLKQNGADKLPE